MAVELTTTSTADAARYRETIAPLLRTWFGLTEDASVMSDMSLQVFPGGQGGQLTIHLSKHLTRGQIEQFAYAMDGTSDAFATR